MRKRATFSSGAPGVLAKIPTNSLFLSRTARATVRDPLRFLANVFLRVMSVSLPTVLICASFAISFSLIRGFLVDLWPLRHPRRILGMAFPYAVSRLLPKIGSTTRRHRPPSPPHVKVGTVSAIMGIGIPLSRHGCAVAIGLLIAGVT